MSRKKKRAKAYTGADAAHTQPTVHRYTAVVRSPFGEWWFEHKKIARIVALVGGGVLIAGYLVYELIRLIVSK